MPIEDRNLKPGTRLMGKYHKQSYSCEVVEGEGGKLRYRLADGREFKSPSAAGMAITGHACDGWVFWSVQTTTDATHAETKPTEANAEAPTPTATSEASSAPEPPEPQPESNAVKKSFSRTPNQRGTPEGQTRWYCSACGKSFVAPAGETPKTCPQGHRAS